MLSENTDNYSSWLDSLQTKPYEGNEPYIFVSYSHKDEMEVFPLLQRLRVRGFRIWYDKGIDPGSEWPEEVAIHLLGCGLFLLFMSPEAALSHHVRREITMALDNEKPFINVFLEETELPPGLQLQLNMIQYVSYPSQDAKAFDEFMDNLSEVLLKKAPRVANVSGTFPQEAHELSDTLEALKALKPSNISEPSDAPEPLESLMFPDASKTLGEFQIPDASKILSEFQIPYTTETTEVSETLLDIEIPNAPQVSETPICDWICSNCDMKNNASNIFCLRCGVSKKNRKEIDSEK